HNVSVGERIRYWRELRTLSRPVLAGQVGRSESWLEKVERGERPADNVHVLLHLARVLKVELGDLLGPGAKLPPDGGGPQDLPKGLPALRRSLYWPDALAEPDRDPERIDLGGLAARIEQAYTASMNGQWTKLALLLPDAIADARALAYHLAGDGQRRAWALLSHAYRLASELCRELRECDLAWIAADRAVAAAERADDRLHMALATRGLSIALLSAGHLDACRAVGARGAALVEQGLESAPPEQVSAWGAIMLASSIAASRAYDHADVRELQSRARWASGLLPDGWIDPVTAFCPTNVAFHAVNAAYDSGDPVEALRLADQVDFDGLPFPSRQARTWLDVARSHGLRRQDGSAVGVLLEAERVAPERMRYDRGAHDLVTVLLRRERKSATPGLRGLAQRLGVN
ncbi:MAG: helix-turn-helix domain-containing protein, partial [Egibacteraceae bacterium]